jgi:dual specificity MAP kinase phosphatase
MKNNGKILVHCQAGRSRSPTIVMAYLMKSQNMTFKQVSDYVISKRSVVRPNISFALYLMRLEQELHLN